jgi:hypothetical protein
VPTAPTPVIASAIATLETVAFRPRVKLTPQFLKRRRVRHFSVQIQPHQNCNSESYSEFTRIPPFTTMGQLPLSERELRATGLTCSDQDVQRQAIDATSIHPIERVNNASAVSSALPSNGYGVVPRRPFKVA